MELRDIEIFLMLAEELHFGRTAERLRVTQPRVSQAIRKQERRIGAVLFERTNRKVTLTPIGRQLADELRTAYRDLNAAIERATLAARGTTDVLRVGTLALNVQDFRPIVDTLRDRHPGCDVQIRHIDFGDPFGPLRAGDVDLAIIWLPVREPDLTVGPIVQIERIMLAMAADHRLAGRESVSYEDLGDETVMGGALPDYWAESLVPFHTPRGRPIRRGPTSVSTGQMLPILSNGEAVSPVHAHATSYLARPDVTYVPIHDAPLARWAIIWRTAAETALIRAFAQAARDVGPVTL